ncbi:MAG: transcriptional regulator [Candidatus Bathyarchaeia archaeon]
MSSRRKKSPVEQDVLRLIMDAGDEGVLQSELWKNMGVDSREGSRAILRLERRGLIARKKELHSGRWTYRLFSKRKYATIDDIKDIPCTFCDLESRCGESDLSPENCERMIAWITAMLNESAEQRSHEEA